MKVFITGGTGFIGSYIVKALSDAGHEVAVLARNPQKAVGLKKLPGVTFLHGDLTDPAVLKNGLTDKEACIHMALNWGDSAVEMLHNDTLASVRLFELAADAGVSSIIYTSSTSVNDWVYTDDDARLQGAAASVYEGTKPQPATYYGATKGAGELYLHALGFHRKIRVNVIRPGYTFGNPLLEGCVSQADTRFQDIVFSAQKNDPIEVIENDGTQFIFAGDLAKVYLSVLESNVQYRMFFGLGNRFISWEDVANQAVGMSGSSSSVVVKDLGWPSSPALFDVSAIDQTFGLSFDAWAHIVDHLRHYMNGPPCSAK